MFWSLDTATAWRCRLGVSRRTDAATCPPKDPHERRRVHQLRRRVEPQPDLGSWRRNPQAAGAYVARIAPEFVT